MDRPSRLGIVPALLMLCVLAGCVVAAPAPRRDVVVERPVAPAVVVRP